ncbi:MAG: transmission trait enhancer LetE [Legionellales bacterium]
MNDITALLPHIKLRFNIDHPSDEECYLFGYECGLSEITEEDNPFQENSHEAELWLEGWWSGIYGETPLFALSNLEKEALSLVAEKAANEQQYHHKNSFMYLVLEISGAIAASALVGYQLLELVA